MEKTYEMLQQYAVNSLEYQKGRALHQRGQAALSSAEEAHGRTQIQATVRDLSRRYDVEMTIQSTGLAADGITVVDDIYYIERGYEALEDKLTKIGATIAKVEDEKELQKFILKVS